METPTPPALIAGGLVAFLGFMTVWMSIWVMVVTIFLTVLSGLPGGWFLVLFLQPFVAAGLSTARMVIGRIAQTRSTGRAVELTQELAGFDVRIGAMEGLLPAAGYGLLLALAPHLLFSGAVLFGAVAEPGFTGLAAVLLVLGQVVFSGRTAWRTLREQLSDWTPTHLEVQHGVVRHGEWMMDLAQLRVELETWGAFAATHEEGDADVARLVFVGPGETRHPLPWGSLKAWRKVAEALAEAHPDRPVDLPEPPDALRAVRARTLEKP